MEALLRILLGLLAVVGAFGFIIFIHEMGHFLAARAVGIRCPDFAIGFGPSLFEFRWRGTRFAVRLFPIGGYVLMTGEEPEAKDHETWHDRVHRVLGGCSLPATPKELRAHLAERRESLLENGISQQAIDEVDEHLTFLADKSYPNLEQVEGNFNHRTIPQRMLVISGGVLMNFAATILILVFSGLVYGRGDIFSDFTPRVGEAMQDRPAATAGLEQGDKIVSVAGVELLSGVDMIDVLAQYPGQKVPVTFTRWDEPPRTVEVVPDLASKGIVFRGSPPRVVADQEPLKAGQVITAVDGQPVADIVEMAAALKQTLGDKKSDQQIEVALTLEGVSEPVKLKGEVGQFEPRGQIGVLLGSVARIHLETESTTTVTAVTPDSLAAKMGIQPGDKLVSINGYDAFSPATEVGHGSLVSFALERLAQREGPIQYQVLVARGDDFEVLKAEGRAANLEQLGVTLTPLGFGAIVKSPLDWIEHSVTIPVKLFVGWWSGRVKGKEIAQGVSGPIGIMQTIYVISHNGLAAFLFFLGLLNAAVGGFNLIPFPALDGSRLLILMLAGLRGREFDPDKEARFHFTGLVILLTLVIFVTFFDVQRLFVGSLPIE